MLQRDHRAFAAAATLLAGVSLALAACGGGEEASDPGPATEPAVSAPTVTTASETSAPATTANETSAPATTAAEESTETAGQPATTDEGPESVLVRVEGGEPVGGVAEITVKNGDVVRLAVTSDVPDEVHIHGYDISKPVAPGSDARFRFTADIEGVFEIELEESALEIASLTVEPK